MKPNDGRYSTAALSAPGFCHILWLGQRVAICCQVLSASKHQNQRCRIGGTGRRTSQPGWQYERSIGFLKPAEVAERQTHQLEGLAIARSWGFKSPLPHQYLSAKK